MTDILERLANSYVTESIFDLKTRCFDAAAEISRLRADLATLKQEKDHLIRRDSEWSDKFRHANELAERNGLELLALKQAQEPVLYQCTKCGGANYGCTCDSLKYCTAPLIAAPKPGKPA